MINQKGCAARPRTNPHLFFLAIKTIDPNKDVDGFHPHNITALLEGRAPFVKPVLAQSIWALINEGIALQNRYSGHDTLQAILIGNSTVFTIPVASYLKSKGIKTDTALASTLQKSILKNYNIIIVACGRPKFITKNDLKNDAVIIDIGTNKLPDGRTCGDVDFESFTDTDCSVTPVPRGVGPVTVAMLMKNTVELAKISLG